MIHLESKNLIVKWHVIHEYIQERTTHVNIWILPIQILLRSSLCVSSDESQLRVSSFMSSQSIPVGIMQHDCDLEDRKYTNSTVCTTVSELISQNIAKLRQLMLLTCQGQHLVGRWLILLVTVRKNL